GQILLKLGKNEEAKAAYRIALEKRPDLICAQLGLARAHKAAGQFAEAQKLARAIIQSPNGQKNMAAYDVLAESLEAQGEPQAAMDVLRDAAGIVPSAKRYRLAGESAYRNGDLQTAKENMTKVTKATKGSVVAQSQDSLLLAQSLVDLGETDDAMKVLKDVPDDNRPSTNLPLAVLSIQAQAEARAGKTVEAEKTLAKAREALLKGKADFATVALAKAELMTGNEAAGLALLDQAVSADHENVRVKQMIGKALQDTGHGDKVETVVQAAVATPEAKVQDARKLMRDSQV